MISAIRAWLFRRAFTRDRRGSAAVEFAIVAPIIGVMLAGAADFGGVLYVKYRMENAVSAGANYALINGSKFASATVSGVTTKIAAIVASGGVTGSGSTSVVANNSVTADNSAGVASSTGTSTNADVCYCPTVSGSTLTWGTSTTCGSACGSGAYAGKFVRISTTRNYSPLFSNYGIVSNGSITVSTTVQVQ